MKKNTIILMMCVGLLLIGVTAADVRVDSYYLDDYSIEAGDDVDVYVKFYRASTGSLISAAGKITYDSEGGKIVQEESKDDFYTIQIVPDSGLSEEYILIVNQENRVGHVSVGESWASDFQVKIRDNAPAADYDMMFKVYKTDPDYKNKVVILQEPFSINVRGTPKLDITAENTMGIGSTGEIGLTIDNRGGGVAKDVSVALSLTAPFTPVSSSKKYIGSINANESVDVSFKVSVATDAVVKTHEIPVTVTYTDDNGSVNTLSTSIGVQIDSKPKLSFGIDEVGELAPGLTGEVILSISNEDFVDAKFLKFSLQPTEDYEVLSIDEIYIGNLDSDDVETQEFTIKVSDSVDKTVLPLKVTLKYKGAGSDVDYLMEDTVDIKILSRAEHAAKYQANGTSATIMAAIFLIPALFIGLLVLWFVYKLFGLVTGFINRKLFVR